MNVIEVKNVSKKYRLGYTGTGNLKDDISGWWAKIRGRPNPNSLVGAVNDRTDKKTDGYVNALNDITFNVEKGEVLGIIGKNGAGKSTLLKILTKITGPTTGSIKMNGRVGSLLEVGTGFNLELSGRENIYLNGAILGMRKAEIDAKFFDIVDFSGVAKYIDTPVKRYSTGMRVRLGFAVAAFLEPEILIIDEVLAVGDLDFQQRAIGKMQEVSASGKRTVLFVSHNMASINALCNKAMLLENGTVSMVGSTERITTSYYNQNQSSNEGEFQIGREGRDEEVVINKVILEDDKGENTVMFKFGHSIKIKIELIVEHDIENPYIWLVIRSKRGPVSGANGMIDGFQTSKLTKGSNWIECTFEYLPLMPDPYTIHMGVRASNGRKLLTKSKDIARFSITSILSEIGFNGNLADSLTHDSHSPIIPYKWKFNDGKEYEFKLDNYVKL